MLNINIKTCIRMGVGYAMEYQGLGPQGVGSVGDVRYRLTNREKDVKYFGQAPNFETTK